MNPTDEKRCLELIDDYLDEQLTEEQIGRAHV